jgi:fluoride ion exporter CrcB/FEX
MKKRELLLVFFAGTLGALLRYGIAVVFQTVNISDLFSTLVVNLTAGFLAGIIITANNDALSVRLQKYETAVVGGFLGGFSTVAAVSSANFMLMFVHAQIFSGLLFLAANYFGALALAKFAVVLTRRLSARIAISKDAENQ